MSEQKQTTENATESVKLSHKETREKCLQTGWEDPFPAQKRSRKRNNNDEGGKPRQHLQGDRDMQFNTDLTETVKKASEMGATPQITISVGEPLAEDVLRTAAKTAVAAVIVAGTVLAVNALLKDNKPEAASV